MQWQEASERTHNNVINSQVLVGGSQVEDNNLETARRSINAAIKNLSKQLIRDISFRPRFRYNYGLNQEYYEKILGYKESWQDKLFYVDEKMVQLRLSEAERQDSVLVSVSNEELNLKDYRSLILSEEEALKELEMGDNALTVTIEQNGEKEKSLLQFGKSIDFAPTNRNGIILNAGGQVISMEWLNNSYSTKDSNFQFIALSVIFSPDGIRGVLDRPELSLFSNTSKLTTNSINTALQIWRYDLNSKEVKLQKILFTLSMGVASCLKWLPINFSDELDVLGVLCATFSDGTLHLLKLYQNMERTTYERIEESSLQYQIEEPVRTNSSNLISISSYDFIDKNKIIVGLSNGSIAEFILPYYHTRSNVNREDIEADVRRVSYLQAVADSPIISISVANVEDERKFIFVHSAGSQSFLYEYNHISHERVDAYPVTSYLRPIYNESLKLFVHSDSWDSVGYSFLRHPHEKPSSLLKLDGMVSALALSEIIGHPLILCGNTFGEIFILNIARKILNSSKATNKSLVPLKLWNFSFNKDDNSIEVCGDFEVISTEKNTKLSIASPDITISDLCWNENPISCSLYAASSLAGLVLMERLDPNVT